MHRVAGEAATAQRHSYLIGRSALSVGGTSGSKEADASSRSVAAVLVVRPSAVEMRATRGRLGTWSSTEVFAVEA